MNVPGITAAWPEWDELQETPTVKLETKLKDGDWFEINQGGSLDDALDQIASTPSTYRLTIEF